jgi:hypothetical protein
MLPITNESIILITLITSCLTSNYLTFLLSSKWISLEVINILTARRNTSRPKYNKYGVNTGRTNRGIPHSNLPKVTGVPTFDDLNTIRRLLNAIAMSISSYEGGGRHGHLGLIITNAEYFAVTTDVFLLPDNPEPAATIVAGMMGVHIAEMRWLHTAVTCVYRTHHNVDQAFTKMLINVFEDQYLNTLSDEIFGYANCTSLQLLTHLLTYYAMIAPRSSRRTTSVSTRRMIITNRSRISFNKSGCLSICGGRWTTAWRCDDHKCCVYTCI